MGGREAPAVPLCPPWEVEWRWPSRSGSVVVRERRFSAGGIGGVVPCSSRACSESSRARGLRLRPGHQGARRGRDSSKWHRVRRRTCRVRRSGLGRSRGEGGDGRDRGRARRGRRRGRGRCWGASRQSAGRREGLLGGVAGLERLQRLAESPRGALEGLFHGLAVPSLMRSTVELECCSEIVVGRWWSTEAVSVEEASPSRANVAGGEEPWGAGSTRRGEDGVLRAVAAPTCPSAAVVLDGLPLTTEHGSDGVLSEACVRG